MFDPKQIKKRVVQRDVFKSDTSNLADIVRQLGLDPDKVTIKLLLEDTAIPDDNDKGRGSSTDDGSDDATDVDPARAATRTSSDRGSKSRRVHPRHRVVQLRASQLVTLAIETDNDSVVEALPEPPTKKGRR